jgi:hypothetical protein
MRIYGIASAEAPDKVNETAILKGMSVVRNPYINDEHGSASKMFNVLGSINLHKKIYSEKDCANKRERQCWDYAKVPFLYVEGSLADEEEHPNAQAASALIKYATQNSSFNLGFSVEGSVDERDGNKLSKTEVRGVSLTISPCNPLCKVFSVDSLAKSSRTIELPEKYKNAIGSLSSFIRIPDTRKLLKAKIDFIEEVSTLAKSNSLHKAKLVKCWNCGCQKVYIAPRLPNACSACGEGFSMKDISTALLTDKKDFL